MRCYRRIAGSGEQTVSLRTLGYRGGTLQQALIRLPRVPLRILPSWGIPMLRNTQPLTQKLSGTFNIGFGLGYSTRRRPLLFGTDDVSSTFPSCHSNNFVVVVIGNDRNTHDGGHELIAIHVRCSDGMREDNGIVEE